MNRPGFDGGSDDTEGSLSWDSRKYSLELGERATRTGVGRAGGSGAGQGRHPSDRQGAGNPSRGSEHLGAPGLGPNQGTRPGTTTDEAQRIKEPALEVRELRRANAILKSASACLSRRSVSARPADLPVHRLPQEGGARGLADLQGAHWRRSQDRPEYLTHARRSRPPSARSLRDETLKAEISKVHKNQLLGAGARKMHVMRGRPEIAERHGAGHVARCTARAAHGRPGPTRCQTRQVAQNDALGSKGPVPGRPRQKACQRVQAERAVGRRHSPASGRYPLLRTHLLRVGLRRLRHRCLLAANRGLADHLSASVHRPGPGRPSDGRLAAETSRC